MPRPQESKCYTYADYCNWDDGGRWELIDGVAYAMAPAPSLQHQGVLVELLYKLRSFLEGKPCRVFVAPFDVRLNADTDDDIVVQPDIAIVCDSSKLDEKGCVGAPDMVIEVISPSSLRHDKLVKFQLYQKYGVREYWVVDPDNKMVTVHILDNGKYDITVYGDENTVPARVLEGCKVNLREVFGWA